MFRTRHTSTDVLVCFFTEHGEYAEQETFDFVSLRTVQSAVTQSHCTNTETNIVYSKQTMCNVFAVWIILHTSKIRDT